MKIELTTSERIDYCCQCKKEHGYDCPLDNLSSEFVAGEELKQGDIVTVKGGKVYKWRKKRSNIYSDFEFVIGGIIFVIGCYVTYIAPPVLKIYFGIPLILVSFLAFYLGYLCLD